MVVYVGVNTGTSMDAIDVAFFEMKRDCPCWIAGYSYDWDAQLRHDCMAMVNHEAITYRQVVIANQRLSQHIAQAVLDALNQVNLAVSDITALGLHGQTIHHYPEHQPPYSLQLNPGHDLAQVLAIPIVTDFRQTDIALGGMGAPLMPLLQQYMLKKHNHNQGVFLNMGGIACVSMIDVYTGTSLAYDVGPANALMDAWIGEHQGLSYDDQGQWARSGEVHVELLQRLKNDEYFSKEAPKSTGRDYFSLPWLKQKMRGLTIKAEDVQATLMALTVVTIAEAVQHGPLSKAPLWVHGKGVANRYFMDSLNLSLPQCSVSVSDDLGVAADWMETALFAWLAYCYDQRRVSHTSFATGASRSGVLGVCYYPASWGST